MGAADPRTWLPLVAACAVFAGRETLRTEDAAFPPPARSVTMPQLQGPVAQLRKASYDLDRERSSVRFLLRSNGSDATRSAVSSA